MCLFGNSDHRLKEAENQGYHNGYRDGEQQAVQLIIDALTQQRYALRWPGTPRPEAQALIQPLLTLLSDNQMKTQMAEAIAAGHQTVLDALRNSLEAKRVARLEAQVTELSQALQTARQARNTLQTECAALAEKLAAEQTTVSQQAKLIVLTEARQQKQP